MKIHFTNHIYTYDQNKCLKFKSHFSAITISLPLDEGGCDTVLVVSPSVTISTNSTCGAAAYLLCLTNLRLYLTHNTSTTMIPCSTCSDICP